MPLNIEPRHRELWAKAWDGIGGKRTLNQCMAGQREEAARAEAREAEARKIRAELRAAARGKLGPGTRTRAR